MVSYFAGSCVMKFMTTNHQDWSFYLKAGKELFRIDKVMRDRIVNQLDGILEVQLGENAGTVRSDCRRAQEKLARYFLHALARGE